MLRNKFINLLLSVVVGISAIAPLSNAFAASATNLIANPGFESNTQNSNLPDDWTSESWGTNTAKFTYLNTGHGGSHSAETTVSGYKSGDAKWIFNPVAITAGTQYSYSDWYESNTSTNIWAQYSLNDGTVQYDWLGSEQAETAWTQASETLTAPSNATAVSVFHVINSNGSLTIDDASLTVLPTCSVSESNGVFDGGFEQSCPSNPNVPADWNTESVGNPGATFSRSSQAHSGNYSVQTTMANSSGEAGWQTVWQGAASNQRYNLNFWHNGTTYVYAYVAVQLTDGSMQYISLMSVPATQNTGWSQYTDSFVTPANTSTIQITIATSGPGTFYLDDVYLNTLANQTPPNFNQGVVSLTFDDGDASSFNNGFPVLMQNNLKGTYYLNGSTLNTNGYMSTNDVKELYDSGEEIGSHEYEHLDQVTLTQAKLIYELTENNSVLGSVIGSSSPITDFAEPYGSYTTTTLNTVMQYYQSSRDTDGQFNTKANLNVRQIHAILVTSSTSTAQVASWITQAQQQDEWLVLVYHAIGSSPLGGDGDGYSTTPSHFLTEMSSLRQSGATVMTVSNALKTLLPQEQ